MSSIATTATIAQNNTTEQISFAEITNLIILILLVLILISCITLILCVRAHGRRSRRKILDAISHIAPQNSPTSPTVNTVQSEAITDCPNTPDKDIKNREFSITVNRIHRAFATAPSVPAHITEIHRNAREVNANGQMTPYSTSHLKEPQMYEMEGQSAETSLAYVIQSNSANRPETDGSDSDESMYEKEESIDVIMGQRQTNTPKQQPFVIDISEISENDACEEKAFQPLEATLELPKEQLSNLSLTAQIADASNQYRALEKIMHEKQKKTLESLQINWKGSELNGDQMVTVDCGAYANDVPDLIRCESGYD